MNGFKLFAQIKFFLPFFNAVAHAVGNFLFSRGHFGCGGKSRSKSFSPCGNRRDFKNFLLFFFFKRAVERSRVHEHVRVGKSQNIIRDFGRGVLFAQSKFFIFVFRKRYQSVKLGALFVNRQSFLHADYEKVLGLHVFGYFRAVKPLDMHAYVVTHDVYRALYVANHANRINILGRRIVVSRFFLRAHEHVKPVHRRKIKRGKRFRPAYVERGVNVWKYYLSFHRNHRNARIFAREVGNYSVLVAQRCGCVDCVFLFFDFVHIFYR